MFMVVCLQWTEDDTKNSSLKQHFVILEHFQHAFWGQKKRQMICRSWDVKNRGQRGKLCILDCMNRFVGIIRIFEFFSCRKMSVMVVYIACPCYLELCCYLNISFAEAHADRVYIWWCLSYFCEVHIAFCNVAVVMLCYVMLCYLESSHQDNPSIVGLYPIWGK